MIRYHNCDALKHFWVRICLSARLAQVLFSFFFLVSEISLKSNDLSLFHTGIEHRISSRNFYFNETKGFYCLRNDTADKCLRETKGRKHPHVDPLVVSKLRKFYAEHNQKFYELVGEDLGWPEE